MSPCHPLSHVSLTFQLNSILPPAEKDRYLSERAEAMTLQHAFIREVNVDIVGRVMDALREATRLPVRMAKEEDREYFAGLLRVMDNAVQCHADFAPHVCPSPLYRRTT